MKLAPAAPAFGLLLVALITAPRTIPVAAHDPRAADPRPVSPGRQLSIVTERRGHGREARPGDRLSVLYVGKPPSASSPPAPSTPSTPERPAAMQFVLGEGQVIEGWDEGLVGQREGEKRKLVIPAAMAYGARGREGVSPGETLVYEIELAAILGEGHDD